MREQVLHEHTQGEECTPVMEKRRYLNERGTFWMKTSEFKLMEVIRRASTLQRLIMLIIHSIMLTFLGKSAANWMASSANSLIAVSTIDGSLSNK